MAEGIRWVGLDVHACRTAVAVFDTATGEVVKRTVLGRPHETIGQLTMVVVPTVEQEQVRDLVRAREDVRGDLMRARHRLGKLLLRREIYFPGKAAAWTADHRDWLASLRFEDSSSEATFQDYLHAHDTLIARRDRLDEQIEQVALECSFAWEVARLRCLRGIDTLSAMGLCAETRGLGRFEKPMGVSAFLGIVPSESTTGDKRRIGAITKAGSVHGRRLLVEAAWHYRKPPRLSGTLRRRQDGADPATVDCAWRAQRRLHQRWRDLHTIRGKRATITAIAVARELSHFCWEITRP